MGHDDTPFLGNPARLGIDGFRWKTSPPPHPGGRGLGRDPGSGGRRFIGRLFFLVGAGEATTDASVQSLDQAGKGTGPAELVHVTVFHQEEKG
jgi:hypothetical protein